MSRDLTSGQWFDLKTVEEHHALKKYGRLINPSSFNVARIQIGEWDGPGRYLLLSYTQRCPRNCCDDTVFRVLSAKEVLEEAKSQIRELGDLIRRARDNFPKI